MASDAVHSFVHVELYSDQPDATQAFYETVFGWRFTHDEAADHTMFEASAPPHGGLMDRAGVEAPIPPVLAYVLVADLHEARWAVRDAGGTIHRKQIEVPGAGTLSIVEAPGGIVLALWEDAGAMTDQQPPKVGPPGSLVHVDLRSEDVTETERFLEEVFGWRFTRLGELDYRLFETPRPPHGGLAETDPASPVPNVLVHIAVGDLDDAIAAIEAEGGKIVEGPWTVQDFGRGAIFQAPGGIVQGIWDGER